MALYYYKGVKGGGKKASGFVPAHTDKEAERNVERLAIRNYTIKKIASSLGGAEFVVFKDMGGKKLSQKNQAYFFEQLSFLLKAGLTLFQCIDIMTQSSNIDVAKLAVQLKPSIVSGLSLDEVRDEMNKFIEKRRIDVYDGYMIVNNIMDLKRFVDQKSVQRQG